MNRGKQTAIVFTILMIVFAFYSEFLRQSADPPIADVPKVPDVPAEPYLPKVPTTAPR